MVTQGLIVRGFFDMDLLPCGALKSSHLFFHDLHFYVITKKLMLQENNLIFVIILK